jgi:hypothetical protein
LKYCAIRAPDNFLSTPATIPVFESVLRDSMIPILEPVLPVQPTVSSNALFPPLKLHYCPSSSKKFIISYARYEMKGITHLQEAWRSAEANGFLIQHGDSDYGSDKAALVDRDEMKYLTA